MLFFIAIVPFNELSSRFSGMVPRGEVGLVFAGSGSASGALSSPLEAAIIIMVILTTFLAPLFVRLTFGESAPQQPVESVD